MKKLLVGAVIAGVGVFAMKGCLSKAAPDEDVGKQLSKVCDIAKANVETPERGVRQLGRYFGAHLGDLTGAYGDTIAMIESIPDDAKHDARAREARNTMFAPIHKCQRELLAFAQAVSEDEASNELIQHAADRLSRTFEIIFSGQVLDGAGHLDVKALERTLEQL
jgi:hypothetical protein